MGHGRVDETGRYRIHRDVTAGIFPSNRFCKPDDGRLRGRVICLPRIPDHPEERGDVDDTTIPLLGQRLQDRLCAVKRTVSVASATLTFKFRAFRPSFSTDAIVSTERPGSRSATAISAPVWARHSAMARPIPCAAPVTMA